ncbi:MAG TPA: hypothetical protein VIS99_16325 [Terrimicrobiaceae bacterium]
MKSQPALACEQGATDLFVTVRLCASVTIASLLIRAIDPTG